MNSGKLFALVMLVSLYPVVDFSVQNFLSPHYSLQQSVVHLLINIFVNLMLYAAARKILKYAIHSAILGVTIINILFFNAFLFFPEDYSFGPGSLSVYWLTSLSLLGLLLRFGPVQVQKNLLKVLVVTMTAMIFITGGSLIDHIRASHTVAVNTPQERITSLNIVRNANIYFIVPDQMVGLEYYRFTTGETHPLHSDLKQRDFEVHENYYTPAPETYYSLSQIYEMDYLLEADLVRRLADEERFKELVAKQNRVSRIFKENSYRIYTIDSSLNMTPCWKDSDICIRYDFLKGLMPSPDLTSYVTLQTRLFYFARSGTYEALRSGILWFSRFLPEISIEGPTEDYYEQLPGQQQGPLFFLGHFDLPHTPIRFDEKCRSKQYKENPLTGEHTIKERFDFYMNHMPCTRLFYSTLVDAILKKDPDAWIVISNDHGTFSRDQHLSELQHINKLQIFENLNGFLATRLPPSCSEKIGPYFPSVDIFPLLFSCLEGRESEFQPRPSRYFLSYYLNQKAGEGGKVREVDIKPLIEAAYRECPEECGQGKAL